MKVDKYYDVCCSKCLAHLSTDFNKGLQYSRDSAITEAKKVGFKDINGRTYCPYCAEKIKNK